VDLIAVGAVIMPRHRRDLPELAAGDAFLGGGTWLFSEPRRDLRRLIDLASLGWPPIEADSNGLSISATCTFAELAAYAADVGFAAAPLFGQCCRALWGSFKIWNTATVGGNLCLALPASPMAALAVALDATGVIWCPGAADRRMIALDLITGPQQTGLAPGEVLRALLVPASALRRAYAFRQASLTTEGRSATLLIGYRQGDGMVLTITAATRRPLRLALAAPCGNGELTRAVDAAVADAGGWYDDLHGAPDWRRAMTLRYAREIVSELGGS
jgi:CO/xanthine dehydrogenase FAD-binding subunit